MKIVKPKFIEICCGIAGAQGPVFDIDGNFYATSPMSTQQAGENEFRDGTAGQLHKIDLETGDEEVVCTPQEDGYGGRPCGCQRDGEGNIWICDMRLGILKYTPGSGYQQISKVDTDGNALNGCNDLIFDKDGNLWVTGPASAIAPSKEDKMIIFRDSWGVLYYVPKGELVPRQIQGQTFAFCNGIMVRDNLLLVAETMSQSILAFDIVAPGELANRRLWAKLPRATYENPLKLGGPDGMAFDARGNLLVTHYSGGHLEVFSPDGKLETRIVCPFKSPSNLRFVPGSKTCIVTDHDENGVWKFEWECEGMPPNI